MIPTIAWRDSMIRILDQTRLPEAEIFLDLSEIDALCEAIQLLRIRGAPAIGIAGAYGVALAARQAAAPRGAEVDDCVAQAAERIRTVRPTAANLAWGVDRVLGVFRQARSEGVSPDEAARRSLAEARSIHEEDLDMSRAMGQVGLGVVPDHARIITHCNTGGLATGGLGTALAVVFEAARHGKEPHVFVDETRPLLQGARLTSWELRREGIRATLLVDGAAAWLMASQGVDLALVGADRIAANGDAANKVGTFSLALAAARHGVPFYVVAPSSTFDPSTPSGEAIVVEQRPEEEVRRFGGQATAPADVEVWNPAFDVTPASLIAGWITEQGVLEPPFAAIATRPRGRGGAVAGEDGA